MTETAIVKMLASGQDDLRWFDSKIDSIKSKYDNKFVAFHERKIIDSDSDLDGLMKKLKEKKIDTANIFIRFVSKIKAILY